jgi:hypothetical protein
MADELVTVATYPFAGSAEVVRMRLEAEGIPAFVADAETVSMNWLFGNAVGWVKLQVPASQAEKARAFLEQLEKRRARAKQRCFCIATAKEEQAAPGREDIDSLEREVYELKLYVATLFRIVTAKGIASQEEIHSLVEKTDAEDGPVDEEFLQKVIGPGSP